MATWKITPKYKKSIRDVQYWTKGDEKIRYEIGWRWGEFFIETEGDEMPDLNLEDGIDIMNGDYELTDFSTDDGVYEDYDLDDCTDEVQEQIDEFLQENSIYDLETEGWAITDSEMWIDCEIDIEKCED